MPLWNPYDVSAAIATHKAIADAHQTARKVVTGTYTGDGSDDRQITVGLKCSIVIILSPVATRHIVIVPNRSIAVDDGQLQSEYLHASDGFNVYNVGANQNLDVFYYWAISE